MITVIFAIGPFAAVHARGQDAPATEPAASKPESAPAAGAAPQGAYQQKAQAIRFDGFLDLRYRFRSTAGAVRDQDLLGTLGFDLKIPGVGKKDLKFHFLGFTILDVDRFPPAGDPFAGLAETWDTRAHAYVYEAYAEVEPGGPLALARLGRQVLWREEGIRFDGAYAQTRRQGAVSFTLLGGAPVHFYESSARGDVVAGAGVKLYAGKLLTFTLDEIYVRDRRNVPGVPDREEDLLSVVGAEWRPLPGLFARGSFSMLDDTERRQSFGLSYVDPENGFRANGEILRQNDFTEIPVTEFSPFVSILSGYSPYLEGRLDASKTLFKPVEAGGGYRIRRIIEGGPEGIFNREFDHGYGLIALSPFPVEEVSVTFRGDWFEGGGIDTGGGGVSVEKKFANTARLQASTDYTLYRVDVLSGEERFRSREYALRGRLRVTDNVTIGAGYRFEVDAFDEVHLADVFINIRF